MTPIPLSADNLATLIVRRYIADREQLREMLWSSGSAAHVESTTALLRILRRMPPTAQVVEYSLRHKIPVKSQSENQN